MEFHFDINLKTRNSEIMALLILILSIASITSFNPVASSGSSQLSPDSGPLLDFGFSWLIDDLVSASNDSANHDALIAVYHEIGNQFKLLTGLDKSISGIIGINDNRELHRYIASANSIEDLYQSLQWYSVEKDPDRKKLQEFTKEWTEIKHPRGIWYNFQRTDLLTQKNFMDLLIENLDINNDYFLIRRKVKAGECILITQSPQYKIYEVYRKLVITTVKAYAVRVYGFNLRRRDGIYRFTNEKKWERTEYEETIRKFQKSAISALTTASRDIRSCHFLGDQEGQQLNIELKWLFNSIVINEAYLNKKASCWSTCADYQNTTFYQYTYQPLEELNICHGRIYNCFRRPVKSYCSARKNYRRFDGLYPKKMGKRCHSRKIGIYKKVSDGAFDRCDQCICYCDDYDRSDTVRTFSLRAVESDTSKNRVITGIQFVEKNQMIYLRIEEGELRPNGTIEESTVEWKPVDEFDHKSSFTSQDDFFTITYDRKYVNLDTLVASNGRVLTGIGFYAEGSHLALQIRTHAFNYSTGILQSASWESYDPTIRQEITMTAPDNPTHIDSTHMRQNVVDTRQNTYVTFRMTDFEKDSAQTAIPLINARPVVSHPRVPLSGAGIDYSSQNGYGGFIGLKVVTYDFTEMMSN